MPIMWALLACVVAEDHGIIIFAHGCHATRKQVTGQTRRAFTT